MSDSESVLKKYPWTLISTTIFIACALVMAIYEQFKPDEVKADQVVEEESSDLPALVINRETGAITTVWAHEKPMMKVMRRELGLPQKD